MRILFVGDIYGKPGRRAASELVPKLIEEREIDFTIMNGENAAGGFGITENIGSKLHAYGADVITTGNHVWDQKSSIPYIAAGGRILRPSNYPKDVGGTGAEVIMSKKGIPIGVINVMGRTGMRPMDCPFRSGMACLEELKKKTQIVFIDFHAEATSEKIAFGWYMNGSASAVVGTHTHVQTADETILPRGTAYITDVGMTGPHNSVIGAQKEAVIQQFLDRLPTRYEPATEDVKLCGVIVDVDNATGRAQAIERLRIDLVPVEGS
ncbi:MAG: TIGR00282 family metallophosphoesterase [Gemmatimonadetes bacterium]|jgi:metallophosphoesterase (TIGR00282 family)|nr:TIGR00282 family metallophosphoesterase [Gemmatimonadota bacterium]HCK09953.1 TIGR00282 family metallophosphoesterase [Candidatus Latescibacterota bacterium]